MKKLYCRFISFCCLLLLSSCISSWQLGFDIYERAHIREDNSGKFEISIDLTKIRTLLKIENIITQSSNPPNLIIKNNFLALKRHLSTLQGIRRVSTAHNAELLYFRLHFYFDNIVALNNAMSSIFKNVAPPNFVYFKKRGRLFERAIPEKSMMSLLKYYQERDSSSVASFDIPFFFQDGTYTTLYSFNRVIKKVINPLSKILKGQKALMIQCYPFDEQNNELSISNKLLFY